MYMILQNSTKFTSLVVLLCLQGYAPLDLLPFLPLKIDLSAIELKPSVAIKLAKSPLPSSLSDIISDKASNCILP
jgi:hypothetical protein